MTKMKAWRGLLLVACLLASVALTATACTTASRTPSGPGSPLTPQATVPKIDLTTMAKPTDLNSFRSTIQLTWQGTDTDGTELGGTFQVTEAFVRQPPARHVTMSGNIPGLGGAFRAPDEALEMYLVDNTVFSNYMGSWTQKPADDSAINAASYAYTVYHEVLSALARARYVGTESRSGVETEHFSWDQSHLDPTSLPKSLSIASASGNLFVAVDGDYVVHLDATMTGDNLGIPTGLSGTAMPRGSVNIAIDLWAVNQPLTIQVPQEVREASGPPPDLPVPADAQDIDTATQGIVFVSLSTPQEVAAFYTAEMPRAGWTQTKAEEASGSYRLAFEKDLTTVTIHIADETGAGRTVVRITLGGAK